MSMWIIMPQIKVEFIEKMFNSIFIFLIITLKKKNNNNNV